VVSPVDRLIETGRVPDSVLRAGIRASCHVRLAGERVRGRTDAFAASLGDEPIALQVDKPNEQHYEVPARFFELVLGPRPKYSSCLFPTGGETLADAEEAMLGLTCERAEVEDGMDILDLGCGWGSLTFWLAERYPGARIVGVSNSRPQREFILSRGLPNVEVVTADANVFEPGRKFDRVMSVEMLEHMRNYPALFARIASWLEPGGKLFVHVFSHRRYAYPYDSGWMSRKFFTAGLMPSHDLLPRFQRDLLLEDDWVVDGTHYARSAEAWVRRMDENEAELTDVLAAEDGPGRAPAWLANWRVFFLACAELWGLRGGQEWGVSHYRFAPRG
jgi:cyclopropane-fatty-acyl-phospholipid synthase